MGKISKLGKAVGGGLLGLCLNPKMRRMIVVVSTATYLHTLNRSGECKLKDLNDKCRLSHNVHALDFPAAVGSNLWKGSELDNIDLHGGHDSIVTKILDNIPPWLRYGRISDMQKDVQGAVEFALS
tara:strand:+ start:199266 stop:199643 length:378 start_codon:yes stop_codon:yes gene_type:complete